MSHPVYYTGENYSFDNGDKLVHGQQGEVVRPGTGSNLGKCVVVRFPGHKGNVQLRFAEVSRRCTPPPATQPHTCCRRWL